MTSLSDLIERLEKATGADRELDALIYIQKYPESADDPGPSIGGHGWAFLRYGVVRDDVPLYTDSVDAARTLVPKGHHWHLHVVSHFGCIPCAGVCPDGDDRIEHHAAPTPAIALCIASLKARMKVAG